MSNAITKNFMRAYFQDAEPTAFFSGMFRADSRSFHNSEEVEIDIQRSGEQVSVAVQDLSSDYRYNDLDDYTNKGFKPPVHKEAFALKSSDLLKRNAGENPFEDREVRFRLVDRAFQGFRKVEAKVRRAMELQAAQVMQTGKVTLTDESGNAVYELDYKPKASHFPTAGTTWASATLENKISDIQSLCNVIRADGKRKPDRIIFGETAWENFIQTDGFDKRFDALRADLGEIQAMQFLGEGGIYHGTLDIGNYKLAVWTYDGRYDDPQTGDSTQFMDPGKVAVQASGARMDAAFGVVPNIGRMLGANPILPGLPQRMSDTGARMDLHTNVWMSPDGETLLAGVGSRPLMIPVAIDTFGCLDTQL